MNRGTAWKWAVGALAGLYVAVLGAGYLAPYDPAEQHRETPLVAPQAVHFENGRLFVEDPVSGRPVKLHLFSGGHLFGVVAPAVYFPLGSDAFGRDQFSRLRYGGRISLGAASLATRRSLGWGLGIGLASALGPVWLDALLMRASEVCLALPWLYLLLGVRAFLPLSLEPDAVFLLFVLLAGLLGWARPARLFRGLGLSLKHAGYVEAARGFGASRFYLARRHMLGELRGVLGTQAALLAPQFLLAEVTLSMFGLGINEPGVSWGTMLDVVRQPALLAMHPWIALPVLILVPIFLCFHVCADALAA